MRFIKRRREKFVVAVVGVVALMIAASRQLYLSVLLGGAADLTRARGGSYHLWLAIGALLTTCIAGGLTFFFYYCADDTGNRLRSV